MPLEVKFNKSKNKSFWMFQWNGFWIWPIWLLYDVTNSLRADSVNVQNVERSISRLKPPAECPSVRGATYRIN